MILTILAVLKAFAPAISLLVGWLLPSPLQKATQAPAEVLADEKKADSGDMSGLDSP